MISLLQADPAWFTQLLPQFPLLAVAVASQIWNRRAYKEDIKEEREQHKAEMDESRAQQRLQREQHEREMKRLRDSARRTQSILLSAFEAALSKDDPPRARDILAGARKIMEQDDE